MIIDLHGLILPQWETNDQLKKLVYTPVESPCLEENTSTQMVIFPFSFVSFRGFLNLYVGYPIFFGLPLPETNKPVRT